MTHYLQFADEVLSLADLVPSPEASACLAESSARRLSMVPLAWHSGGSDDNRLLTVACEDPADQRQLDRLRRLLHVDIQVIALRAAVDDIHPALDKCYRQLATVSELIDRCQSDLQALQMLDDQVDFIACLVDALLRDACRREASDIHVSPTQSGLKLRFRIDGVLHTLARISRLVQSRLLVRLKVLASLDIAETRQPQDGQFSLLIDAKKVDFRISTFPCVNGENTVIRVLNHQAHYHTLAALNLPSAMHDLLASALHRPDGLLLISGPTGSGKSTTLYALLAERDSESLNIMTLEDPVERSLPGIVQSSVDTKRSLDYSQGVRALLRQDPDVLLIGEIRDAESCSMAMRAAMTGHQVLTTVHGNDVFAALDRLIELGAAKELLANQLVAVVCQRLLRIRCKRCADAEKSDDCLQCHGTGFKGRQLVMELLSVTPDIQALIANASSRESLKNKARLHGYLSLREQSDELVQSGVTDTDEVLRVLGADWSEAIPESRQLAIIPGSA